MIKSVNRIVVAGAFLMALILSSAPYKVLAAGGGGGGGGGGGDPYSGAYGEPNAPPSSYPNRSGTKATQKSKKNDKHSAIGDPAFARGYREAYATIYERNDYTAAIEQLKALGHDDHPNVANLIGYSYRKLGDYTFASVVRARLES